jgi:3-oxoacyl-[acyl-carrier protein] reductase
VAKLGRLDVLVNNAGVTRDTLLPRMGDEEWDEVLLTNLRGPFLFTRAASRPMMQQRYGRIINVASVSGMIGNAGQANYSASKAGLIGFTKTVSKELAGRKITVNAVAPGFIASDMTAALGPALLDEVKKRVPVKRLGEAWEIAEAVLFLASPSSGYVNGQVIVVDGGLIA